MTTAYPVEAVIEKHAASKRPAVLVVDQRHYDDSYREGDQVSVDLLEYEALGLTDTHAVFFYGQSGRKNVHAAGAFANNLAHLLGLDVEWVL